jgi:hypothetical protein
MWGTGMRKGLSFVVFVLFCAQNMYCHGSHDVVHGMRSMIGNNQQKESGHFQCTSTECKQMNVLAKEIRLLQQTIRTNNTRSLIYRLIEGGAITLGSLGVNVLYTKYAHYVWTGRWS